MGAILKELGEIPIPSDARVDRSSGQVYVSFKEIAKDGVTKRTRRKLVGKLATQDTMYVNEAFGFYFPELYKELFNQDPLIERNLSAGLYACVRQIASTSGIYKLLQDCFGHQSANVIMDYVLKVIDSGTSDVYTCEEHWEGSAQFSSGKLSLSAVSNVLNGSMNDNSIDRFRQAWLELNLKDKTNKSFWLSIDGTNNDSDLGSQRASEDIGDSEIAGLGLDISFGTRRVVAQVWGVDPYRSIPISWFVTKVGTSEIRSFEEIISYVSSLGIKLDGLILDRGYSTPSTLDRIKSLGYDYIIMHKSNTYGHTKMCERYASVLHSNPSLAIRNTGLYGIVDKVNLFKNNTEEDYVALIYDDLKGSDCRTSLINSMYARKRALEQKIAEGSFCESKLTAKEKLYLSLIKDESGQVYKIDYSEAFVKECERCGISSYTIGTYRTPEEVVDMYDLRDVSEKVFDTIKNALGFNCFCANSDAETESRVCCSFIASVIWSLLQQFCREQNFSKPDKFLKGLNQVKLRMFPNCDNNNLVNKYSAEIEKFFSAIGLTHEDLQRMASDLHLVKSGGLVSQNRYFVPSVDITRKPPGRPRKHPKVVTENSNNPSEVKVPNKGGRPKGSLNKKTIARMEAEAAAGIVKIKRGRGRPQGSLNKKTIARMEADAAAGIVRVKRGKGRPKGSLNKKTIARMEADAGAGIVKVKRGKGRPKGSLNKSTLARLELES